jgi:ribose transport system permease protein
MSNIQETSGPGGASETTTVVSPTASPETEQKLKAAKSRTGKARLINFLEAYALLVLLALIAVFFCFWSETSSTFPTLANMRILLASQAVIGVISLGLLLPLLCQEFDLSVGNIAGLAAIMVAASVSESGNVLAAVALALTIGLVIGGVNALIVTRLHVNGVIATLGMSTILGGIILQRTGGLAPASNIPQSLTNFGTGLVAGVPVIFITLLVIAAITYFVLSHTSLGRQIYAVGSNMEQQSSSVSEPTGCVLPPSWRPAFSVGWAGCSMSHAPGSVAQRGRDVHAACFCGGLPQRCVGPPGAIQRVGHDHRGLLFGRPQ